MNHAPATPDEPRRPPLRLTLFELLPVCVQHAVAVIGEAGRRCPLLSFIAFELAAITAGTLIAFVLLQVIA